MVEELAMDLRRRWNIGFCNPIDIFASALDKMDNLTLFWMPLEGNVSGACSKSEDDILIVINSNHSRGRQNFTLAHELYHLLYEENDGWVICSGNMNQSDRGSESKANKFAASLLLPKLALDDFIEKNSIENWSLGDIIQCEQFFKISHHAMLVKLKHEGMISQKEFNSFRDGIKSEASNRGFSIDLYEPSPKNMKYFALGAYIGLAQRVFEKDRISKGKKDELLMDVFRSDIVYNLHEDDIFD